MFLIAREDKVLNRPVVLYYTGLSWTFERQQGKRYKEKELTLLLKLMAMHDIDAYSEHA